ncbi:MAG: T9SS type A sorting domain-containing protein [Bacteroidota bacterium]
MKVSSTLLFLLCSFRLLACNCAGAYTALEDMLCSFQESDYEAFELRLTSTTDEGAFFTVERVLTGTVTESSIFLFAGNGGNCGLPFDEYPVGSRYLYLPGEWETGETEGYGFECGSVRNIYELNAAKTSIRYMTPASSGSDFPGPLEWIDYTRILSELGCEIEGRLFNPLAALVLQQNPGYGEITLVATNDTLPTSLSIDIFDAAGRKVLTAVDQQMTPTTSFPLDRISPGVYFVVVRSGRWRKTMHYLKL